jgi:hypothetical protein
MVALVASGPGHAAFAVSGLEAMQPAIRAGSRSRGEGVEMSLRWMMLPLALLLGACGNQGEYPGVDGVAYYPPAGEARGVVVYLPGTGAGLNDQLGRDLLTTLGDRGYLGLILSYPSDWYEGITCFAIRRKADDIFGPDGPLAQVYASGLPIVAVGFSQGSWIAHQAGEAVDAAVLFSSGVQIGPLQLRCNSAAATEVERVLAVSGESDRIYLGDMTNQLGAVTGVDCPGARQCWSGDSGWVLALDSEVGDGNADHMFYRLDGRIDRQWLEGDGPWAKRAVIAWIERQMR